MHPSSILDIWDYGVSQNLVNKGLALASLMTQEAGDTSPSEWSIEKRDVALFRLRQKLFGSQCVNIVNCPSCKNKVEWNVSLNALDIPELKNVPDNIEIAIEAPKQKISVRLPNSKDLLQKDAIAIVSNCILSPKDQSKEREALQISPKILASIDEAYEKVCTVSNISYQLSCASCEHTWESLFDIVSYLWKEIDQWAQQFLNVIYVLAKSFGWSEREIIEMPPHRRNYYLRLLTT